jgi:hypothetical protein
MTKFRFIYVLGYINILRDFGESRPCCMEWLWIESIGGGLLTHECIKLSSFEHRVSDVDNSPRKHRFFGVKG